MSFNKIIIVGNLGKDPELRYTPQGAAVCNFSVATNEKKKDKSGEMQDVTTWFRVTLWDKKAEIASKYLTKGSPIYVEGRLRIEEWTDKDGNNRYTLEVNGTDMQFISTGRGDEFSGDSSSTDAGAGNDSDFVTRDSGKSINQSVATDDDIPF